MFRNKFGSLLVEGFPDWCIFRLNGIANNNQTTSKNTALAAFITINITRICASSGEVLSMIKSKQEFEPTCNTINLRTLELHTKSL